MSARVRSRFATVAVLVAACSMVPLPSAQAYIDPGSGSFVFQVVVGGILAAGVAVKVFWKRLVQLVTRRGSTSDDD